MGHYMEEQKAIYSPIRLIRYFFISHNVYYVIAEAAQTLPNPAHRSFPAARLTRSHNEEQEVDRPVGRFFV